MPAEIITLAGTFPISRYFLVCSTMKSEGHHTSHARKKFRALDWSVRCDFLYHQPTATFCRHTICYWFYAYPADINSDLGTIKHLPRGYSLTCFTSDYLLNASNGDRRDAFQAGYTPAAKLRNRESNQTLSRSFARKIGAK